jgi:transposase-like protein
MPVLADRRQGGDFQRKSCTWRMYETFVRIARRWMYLFRAADCSGPMVDFNLSTSIDSRHCIRLR